MSHTNILESQKQYIKSGNISKKNNRNLSRLNNRKPHRLQLIKTRKNTQMKGITRETYKNYNEGYNNGSSNGYSNGYNNGYNNGAHDHNNLINNVNLFKKNENGDLVYKHYIKDADSTFNKNPKRCMCINYKSINDFNTYDRCSNNALDGSDFCQLHQNCKSYLRQFLSGSEYDNDMHLWNDPLVEGSHNCYSYFLNRQVMAVREKCEEICKTKYKSIKECIDDSGCGDLKPQPEDFWLLKNTGNDNNKKRIYKCPEMHNKILSDNPTLLPIEFNKKCPRGYYKGAMVVDSRGSKDGNTYHFYKQISDGTFLHKPGINPVSSVDSGFKGEKGRTIYIPHFANRDYDKKDENNNDEGIFYNGFCGYYCVPRNELVHKNLA